MRPRVRSYAALLALMALSLFWVEGIWASMCSADMEMPVAVRMTDTGLHAAAPVDVEPAGSSHERGDRDSEAPTCPLAPPGGLSCTGAVALPPLSDSAEPGPKRDESAVASSDHAKDLLLAVSLLRPPRA